MKHLHSSLAAISFTMTGLFGFSLADGFTAVLFAASMVLIQAVALLHIPGLFMKAKQSDNGLLMALYGSSIALALLLSVMASVATLSGSFETMSSERKQRDTIQAAVDGYMDAGYITKALTLKETLPELTESPLAAAAFRVQQTTGINGETLITGFIVSLALLLDLFIIFTRPQSESHVTPHESKPVATLDNDVTQVIQAIQQGEIQKPTVREVRQLLGCAQNHAAHIARTCRQLELSI